LVILTTSVQKVCLYITFVEPSLTDIVEIKKQHAEMILHVEDMSIYTPRTARKSTTINYNSTT
jgi:hypothetical protein